MADMCLPLSADEDTFELEAVEKQAQLQERKSLALVTMKTGGFSCGKESLLQEVNTQRETKQELFVGRGGAFRRQKRSFP